MDNMKLNALADYLEIDHTDIEVSKYDDSTFEAEGAEYLVLTDEEADQRAADYIKDSLWCFNANFLVDYTPEGVDEEVIQAVQAKYEDGNSAILKLVGDNLDELIKDAISADGRGHFLSSYDGEENEQVGTDEEAGTEETLYIYRTN